HDQPGRHRDRWHGRGWRVREDPAQAALRLRPGARSMVLLDRRGMARRGCPPDPAALLLWHGHALSPAQRPGGRRPAVWADLRVDAFASSILRVPEERSRAPLAAPDGGS